ALTANALTANALTANALTANALTANALTANALDDPASGEDAAEIIRYSALCMLSASQFVDVTYRTTTGGVVTGRYWGNLGLAPSWASRGLSDSERRWWGACLGAHVNALGISVPISVRGPHAALMVGKKESTEFKARREGAFYADYNPSMNPPLHIYACWDGYALNQLDMSNRLCSTQQCGPMFTVVGQCVGKNAQTEPKACESTKYPDSGRDDSVGNYFVRCHRQMGNPTWPDAPIVEAITTNIQTNPW
ncbi:MAG TPA: hypothetical protein VFU21_27025, partial [Kofleriaceae bacterium]|nr:hypothetical protein [Kofleriaceae bacterium]